MRARSPRHMASCTAPNRGPAEHLGCSEKRGVWAGVCGLGSLPTRMPMHATPARALFAPFLPNSSHCTALCFIWVSRGAAGAAAGWSSAANCNHASQLCRRSPLPAPHLVAPSLRQRMQSRRISHAALATVFDIVCLLRTCTADLHGGRKGRQRTSVCGAPCGVPWRRAARHPHHFSGRGAHFGYGDGLGMHVSRHTVRLRGPPMVVWREVVRLWCISHSLDHTA